MDLMLITKRYVMLFAAIGGAACGFSPSREEIVKEAIAQVRETMTIALPDMPHPEPVRGPRNSDCSLVPGMVSHNEMLTYEIEVPLPAGDDGRIRQKNAIQYWVDKGAAIRVLPYDNGPPNEVNYRGGSISAFPLETRRGESGPGGPIRFIVFAKTPCIAKEK